MTLKMNGHHFPKQQPPIGPSNGSTLLCVRNKLNLVHIKDVCRLELECTYCLTQLSGRYIYIYIHIIYCTDNNYMFRHFSLTTIRLINEKLSKQLYSTCVYCLQWWGKRCSGYETSHLLCRMSGGIRAVLLLLVSGMCRCIGDLTLSYHITQSYWQQDDCSSVS